MAVSILPGSARVTITQRPGIEQPLLLYGAQGASCASTPFEARGELTLAGSPGDSAADWEIGWFQIERVETNWGYYRGKLNEHGSILVQRARLPARLQQSCRDIVGIGSVSDLFYSMGEGEYVAAPGGPFPLRVEAFIRDQPAGGYEFVERNSLTGEPNYLSEFQRESLFCTAFVARHTGSTECLAHFYWSARWQFGLRPVRFDPLRYAVPQAVQAGTGASVGAITSGWPKDLQVIEMMTAPQSFSCNQLDAMARTAVSRVGHPNRRESPVWTNFDVRV